MIFDIMAELTRDDLDEILTSFDESSFVQIDLEIGNFKLTASKKEITDGAQEAARSSLEKVNSIATVKTVTPDKNQGLLEDRKPPLSDSEVEQAKDESIPSGEANYILVKSPMVGIFYRFPRPGAPPFIDVGTEIKAGDTLCIIEVMKTMNTVKSDLRGKILKICAENGQMVEYNQVLFLVRPENGSRIESQENSDG